MARRQHGYLSVLLAAVLILAGCQGGGQPGATVAPGTIPPGSQAQAAVESFARSVLGREVSVIRAGGMAQDLELPMPVRLEVEGALDLASEIYAGLLADGAGVVGTAEGALSDDLDVNIRWSSLGVYTLQVRAAMPGDAEGALVLLRKGFPALAGLSYTPVQVREGYAFWAESSEEAVDPRSGLASLTAQGVLLGIWVRPTRGTWLYAVVGRGEFATSMGQ